MMWNIKKKKKNSKTCIYRYNILKYYVIFPVEFCSPIALVYVLKVWKVHSFTYYLFLKLQKEMESKSSVYQENSSQLSHHRRELDEKNSQLKKLQKELDRTKEVMHRIQKI